LGAYTERFAQLLDQAVIAGQQVDMYKRYGMFAGVHPLFLQQQLIVNQQKQIMNSQRGAMQRFIDRGYQRLKSSRLWRHISKEKRYSLEHLAHDVTP
jgi:hypothetical protein